MTQRLRFLLDTNILIPLQDSLQILEENLANFVRLANTGGHSLLYHPATVADFHRDVDVQRRERNLQRIRQYPALENVASCPWNDTTTSPNDACDNEILYALQCDAVHALVTEDRRLHSRSRRYGLGNRVYTIQTAEDWLRRLHEPRQISLPNIEDVPLYTLTPLLKNQFFNSLRDGYPQFDEWFRNKARENRRAWVYRTEHGTPAALCIYAEQVDQNINDADEHLLGRALKLCTFKVGETVRGRKIGELFLKAAFRYAAVNSCGYIFTHANPVEHDYLINMLHDFGFEDRGTYTGDLVLVKQHPEIAPEESAAAPFDYLRKFFPHFRSDNAIQKFLVPIQPIFHTVLFPDGSRQEQLFGTAGNIGNAIKLAYLCHAKIKTIHPGDILLFYRTMDEQSITSIGIAEHFEASNDAARIASLVRRRTVYTMTQVEKMVEQTTKVILFRLVKHLPNPVTYDRLRREQIITGPIQSIQKISDVNFSKILATACK